MKAVTEVPFFRVELTEAEIDEVVRTLRSGWLTTGPVVRRFETAFAESVGARHAVAVTSATAALHLALEALNVKPGDGVLVPTMTFAATAEVVRYLGAVPVLVDAEPVTLNMDLDDAGRRASGAADMPDAVRNAPVVGAIPVHVGGLMLDVSRMRAFAASRNYWTVEDAAHAYLAAWRASADSPWVKCGQDTANVTCFSFYANKTITTGEGGIAVTNDEAAASRMRLMSLHGLSRDAWDRHSNGSWDYRIVAPGFKYNLTDIAAAIGVHQLERADDMRACRQSLAEQFLVALGSIDEIELPPIVANRIHAWHLYPIRLRLERLTIDRNRFIDELRAEGIGTSVHWRPLHLHPYYQETFGWRPEQLPVATREWERLVSLPLFPAMTPAEVARVTRGVQTICAKFHVR